jgi:hypothetical protein
MDKEDLLISIEKYYLKNAPSSSLDYELYQNSLVERVFNAKMYSNKWDSFLSRIEEQGIITSEISLMGPLAPCYRFSYHKYDEDSKYDFLLVFHISIIAPVYAYFVDVQFMDRPTSRTGLFNSNEEDDTVVEPRSNEYNHKHRIWNMYPNLIADEMQHILNCQKEIVGFTQIPNDVMHNFVPNVAIANIPMGRATYFDFIFTRDRWDKV